MGDTNSSSSKEKPVVKAEPEETAYRLAQLMEKFNVGCVVITDNGSPVGIVTDRDLALAIGTSGFDSKELIAEDIMRSPVDTVEAGASLLELVKAMAQSNVRRLPVIDEGKLVDIVTMDDVISLFAQTLNKLDEVIAAESPTKIKDVVG
ncbi:MAG: CBS domain-containing protein [bacterium]